MLALNITEPLWYTTSLNLSYTLAQATHQISPIWTAYGGYWSMSLSWSAKPSEIDEWLDAGLGRHIELYAPTTEKIWEGYVSSVSANIGSLTVTRGPLLDTVANKVRVAFSTVDTSTTPPTVGIRAFTDWAEDADSQARYGIIERIISVGGASVSNADDIRDLALNEVAEPATDEVDNLGAAADPTLNVEVLGYYHWLKAYVYNSTSTGETNASTKLAAVIAANPNSLLSASSIEANTLQVPQWENDNRVAESVIKGIVALGNATNNRTVFGFYNDRGAIYNTIPTTPIYTRTLAEPEQALKDYTTDRSIKPWEVQPGEIVFYSDLLVGRTGTGSLLSDPRYLFIEQASYTIPWSLTLQGAKVNRLDQLMAQLGLGGTVA